MKLLNTLFLSSLCLFTVINASAASLKANISEQTSAQKNAVKSQQRIDQISQQTTDMIHEYQQVSEELYTLQIYNEQLEKLVLSQEELIARQTEQLGSIEQTEQTIVPLMLRMISTLEQFIQLDLPFLLSERQQRVDKLKQLMDQANVTSAEKYRQILEAFLIEIDYGRTIETWQGIHPDEPASVVNFFRMGRVALVYQSLDSKNAFYWSKDNGQYVPLPPEYLASLKRAFRVANKQTAPEFIKLPVSAPVKVSLESPSSEVTISE